MPKLTTLEVKASEAKQGDLLVSPKSGDRLSVHTVKRGTKNAAITYTANGRLESKTTYIPLDTIVQVLREVATDEEKAAKETEYFERLAYTFIERWERATDQALLAKDEASESLKGDTRWIHSDVEKVVEAQAYLELLARIERTHDHLLANVDHLTVDRPNLVAWVKAILINRNVVRGEALRFAANAGSRSTSVMSNACDAIALQTRIAWADGFEQHEVTRLARFFGIELTDEEASERY